MYDLPDAVITVDLDKMKYSHICNYVEKQALVYWMKKTNCNQTKTAVALNLSRGALRYKLKEHFGDEYFRSSK